MDFLLIPTFLATFLNMLPEYVSIDNNKKLVTEEFFIYIWMCWQQVLPRLFKILLIKIKFEHSIKVFTIAFE